MSMRRVCRFARAPSSRVVAEVKSCRRVLGGSIAGGVVAQATSLGMPYLLRVGVLVLSFATAFALMHDIGFTPRVGTRPVQEIKNVVRDSIANGLAKRPVRWVMLTGPFTGGVTIYAFYAMQPYLLELWGDERAFGIAGLAAATVAGAQIAAACSCRISSWCSVGGRPCC